LSQTLIGGRIATQETTQAGWVSRDHATLHHQTQAPTDVNSLCIAFVATDVSGRCDHRVVVPRFAIGEGFAVYRGATTTGHVHRHAAFQIAIGMRREVAIVGRSGTLQRAAVLVVAPMEPHSLQANPDVLTYFVEPHCVFADRLRERHGTGISAAPELRDLHEDDVRPAGVRPSNQLDPRLVRTLTALGDRRASLPSLAADVGLSPQRLRALARDQLSMPLARWRIWTRLRRAAEALQAGQTLADAASTAGFSDQAHLTRQMREMMGLTPAVVLPLLRSHSLRAT
jgi:AraC-like DNA-binding protein